VSSALTSSLDILPTLTSLAGANLPADRYFDGEDISSVITGTARTTRQVRESASFMPCPETALCCPKLFAINI
jgi:arylsulfatase A-like enzyme